MKTVLFYIAVVVLGISVNVAANAMKFVVVNDGPVTAYNISSSADYKGIMDANFSDSDRHTPDLLTNQNGFGQEWDFLDRPSGTEVVFTYHVQDTGNWFYSDPKFNDDGINHIFWSSFNLKDGTPAVLIGFEDIWGGGDYDLNDHLVLFSNVSPVPEPSTYLMLLAGLLLVYLSRNRGIGGSGSAV